MTDADALKECEYVLLENSNADADGAFATTQFTTTQLIDAFNHRQRQFLKDTACVLKLLTPSGAYGQGGFGLGPYGGAGGLGGQAQVSRYVLPDDWIDTRRLTWTPTLAGGAAGDTYALHRVDAYELDQLASDWERNYDAPLYYHESTLPTKTVEVAKAPNDAGRIGILYTQLGTTLDGSGVAFTVPDVFVPFVKWGALGDLLSQDAEGSDPIRAAYCFTRYEMGVELCKLLIGGLRGAIQS